jgi:hypothetical protein
MQVRRLLGEVIQKEMIEARESCGRIQILECESESKRSHVRRVREQSL